MAAQDNLHSDQFLTVYRGRSHFWDWKEPQTEEDLKGLGMHWTTDLNIARHYASGLNDPEYVDEETGKSAPEMGGHVLYGRVDRKHVVQPYTDEWNILSEHHAILEPDSGDKEVTLRENAPVQVTGLERVHPGKKEGKWKVNPRQFGGGMGTV